MSQAEQPKLFSKVLLVEDDPGHVLLIRRAIEPIVGEIVQVGSVAQALVRLEEESFGLILTDLSLPDSNGAKHVQTFAQKNELGAVVVLTASARFENAVEATRFGARDFLLKTFDQNFGEFLRLSLARVYASLELEWERKKLQAAVEGSEDGLGIVNQEGGFLYRNSALIDLQNRLKTKGEDFFSLYTDSLKDGARLLEKTQDQLRQITEGEVWKVELEWRTPGLLAMDLTLSGLGSEYAPTVGSTSERGEEFVVRLKDITELKRREAFQRELLSTTTHDLKGPMGAILTASELLRDLLEEGSRASEIVVRIDSAAHGVVNLIDEFLSARRLEEGSLILKPRKVSAQELLEELCENFHTMALARKIELSQEAEEGLFLNVDRLGFSRVLSNLIANALKFTPKEGSISVRAFGQEGSARVCVEDTGSGMEPSEVSRVFERFSRLDKHQEVSGSGLGLFVVKSIVNAHGGQIEVRSKVGKGTSFELVMPMEPPVNERGEVICLDFV